jgi:excisionase family DNA binding protein
VADLDVALRVAVEDVIARRLAPLEAMVKALVEREPDAWLGVDEAARVLQVEPVTVRRMAARGDIAAKKCGKVWRIARASLRAATEAEIAALAAEARR